MTARAQRGWRLHNLPRIVDETVESALDAVLSHPEVAGLIDTMKPEDRVRLVGDLLSLKLATDADTAAFFVQTKEQGLEIKKKGVAP